MTLLVALAVLLGALAQSVSGIGFSLVCGPFLVGALGGSGGVRLGVVLSLVLNLVLVGWYRRDIDRRGLLLLLLPSAVVTVPAALAVRGLPDRPAQAAAGAVVVLGALLLASGVRWAAARGPVGAVAVGAVAAVTNVVAGVAGPPVALWTANAGWSNHRTRATLQGYFLGLNVVTLTALGPPTAGGPVVLAALAALAVGLPAGLLLAPRVPDRLARRVTLALALVGGLVVLVRAAVG